MSQGGVQYVDAIATDFGMQTTVLVADWTSGLWLREMSLVVSKKLKQLNLPEFWSCRYDGMNVTVAFVGRGNYLVADREGTLVKRHDDVLMDLRTK